MPRPVVTTFGIGAGAWVLTGAGHLATVAAQALRPETAEAARAFAAMRAHTVAIAGLPRDLYQLDLGMSLVMAVALVFGGLVCLLVARSAPELVTGARSLSGLALAASLAALGLSVWLLPVPPIALFSVAVAAFGWSLAAARPAPAARPVQATAGRG
ncbi:hypothetical protein LG943_03145 [Streptomonospora sp. S1-112]|uniref:Uncharacterized protein n=1 Tax=Streptomonospora mangrovi TaxID=2883123 RepID=A0A9X3NSJ8_9ACTN|nr:hypothetical protein [Streptomonospora mangrovi]MDA0563331.1 hypothetical protein [Streptomonospora mangrovi]